MLKVRIKWYDATCKSGWTKDSDEEDNVEICTTEGFLYKETKLAYFVTSTISTNTANGSEHLGQVIIPKSMRVKLTVLESDEPITG